MPEETPYAVLHPAGRLVYVNLTLQEASEIASQFGYYGLPQRDAERIAQRCGSIRDKMAQEAESRCRVRVEREMAALVTSNTVLV